MQTPPNYSRTEAAHDQFCWMCAAYEKGFCNKYEVPVGHNFSCDSWERDWKTPEKPR